MGKLMHGSKSMRSSRIVSDCRDERRCVIGDREAPEQVDGDLRVLVAEIVGKQNKDACAFNPVSQEVQLCGWCRTSVCCNAKGKCGLDLVRDCAWLCIKFLPCR